MKEILVTEDSGKKHSEDQFFFVLCTDLCLCYYPIKQLRCCFQFYMIFLSLNDDDVDDHDGDDDGDDDDDLSL